MKAPVQATSAGPPIAEFFAVAGFQGEVVAAYRPADLAAEIGRLLDPSAAEETVHWGRNYLYRTHLCVPGGRLEVVVKQFRNRSLRERLRKRRGESKARRSWRLARRFQAADLPTAEPVLLAEAEEPDGPSFFVTRYLEGALEARYLLRAANAGRQAEAFPGIDFDRFLDTLGQTLRRMHEAGIFHRDLSIGNVLITEEMASVEDGLGNGEQPSTGDNERASAGQGPYIIDLNRARTRRRLTLSQRTRDLCRLAIFRSEHRSRFLRAYWGLAGLTRLRRAFFWLYHHGFHLKIATKKRLRGITGALRGWLLPRRPHPHIPAAPDGAGTRDRTVWDDLSDQPHQHAGRLDKLFIRLADGRSHIRQTTAFLNATPRIARRYRRLKANLYRTPVPWDGAGVCLRPHPAAPEALLEAVTTLGIRKVLLRLHPWADDHDAEEELARTLHTRGYELTFSLPQDRDLVRHPGRWERSIEVLAERFVPYGRHFQVGQAINRSKWGIWRYEEYISLARRAAAILRRHPDVEVLGPAVIDFELHVTAGVLNMPRSDLRFDALASLLYVDRRGAPENRQLGFDTVDKVVLLQAIAQTARGCGSRSWITEVNWPLWEGPHAPAGRSVAVDEATQAAFLTRYFLLTLTTGLVERVYWWQLVARGYGLMMPCDGGQLARRPAYTALQVLEKQLAGSTFLYPLPTVPGSYLFLFRRRDGEELVAGWSAAGDRQVTLPRAVQTIIEQDGSERGGAAADGRVGIGAAVRYFRLP